MTNKEKYCTQPHLWSQLPVFCQPWWLDTVCKSWDLALVERQEAIIAIFPYSVETKLGITLIRPAPLTAFSGPLILDKTIIQREKLIAELIQQLPSSGFHFFNTMPDVNLADYAGFEDYAIKERVTYQIALRTTEAAMFENLEGKRRNDIRKAMKELHVDNTALSAEEFSSWQDRMFSNKQVKNPYSVALLEKVFQAARHQNASLSLKAIDNNGHCYGAAWFLYDKEVMYYMLSATHPEHRHRGAIGLLIWHAMVQANEMGLKIFDFEGSQDPGIASFFRKFGGQQKKYFSFEKTTAPLWKLKRKLLG